MEGNNKNTIKNILIGILISITLISGCIESGKEEFKPVTEETNATANAAVESKIGEINESGIENISDSNLSGNISHESNFTNETAETDLNVSENLTEEELKLEYLFGWDNVPGKDNARFVKFLEEDLDIYWADNARIKKSDDNKIITASYGRSSVNLELKERENKITIETIKVTSREDYDFIFKIENGRLKVYKPESKPQPKSQIKRIKFNIRGLMESGDAGLINSKLGDLPGIRYTNIDFMDKTGEVLFYTANITTDEVLKEASFYKIPSGSVVLDLTITLTEEINCTKSGELYCCGKENCKLYP